jgi:hypothetical protein
VEGKKGRLLRCLRAKAETPGIVPRLARQGSEGAANMPVGQLDLVDVKCRCERMRIWPVDRRARRVQKATAVGLPAIGAVGAVCAHAGM